MNPDIKVAGPLPDYTVRVQFANSETKLFDVKPFLEKGIFTELKNVEFFNQVRVASGSLEWPHEQDFSKDTVYILGKDLSP